LTTAAAKADQVCAGGSKPNAQQCYTDTRAVITDAKSIEHVLRHVPTPPRFHKANADLLHGLSIWIQGLTERNKALAGGSAAGYSASYKLVNRGLALQKTALAEYPPDAEISG
jgi:hypothetical protein